MTVSLVISILTACVGILLCWTGWRRLKQSRIISAFQIELAGFVMIIIAAFLLVVSSNLLVYHRLVYEQPVATIQFFKQNDIKFTVEVQQVDADPMRFELQGDEWQLDARILKWQGFANVLGMDAQYKLNRLSGRYTNIDQERVAARSVFEVGERPLIDMWKLASDYDALLGWLIDAAYGSAVYLPMTDQAEYEISVSQSGLIARPANTAAKQAVSKWVGL